MSKTKTVTGKIRRYIPWKDILPFEHDACSEGWERGRDATVTIDGEEFVDLSLCKLTGGDTRWLRDHSIITHPEEYAADSHQRKNPWPETMTIRCIVKHEGVKYDLIDGKLDEFQTAKLRSDGVITVYEEHAADRVHQTDFKTRRARLKAFCSVFKELV